MKNTQIMGILNVTPDSFSDGGRFDSVEEVVAVAKQMVEDGVSILDIGGESTGPRSKDVSLDEELRRVIPVVKAVREVLPEIIISVDTWKSEVAEAALAAGANMVNDVTAGRGDDRIGDIVAEAGVPMVLMYSKDDSARTTTDSFEYDDVMTTILEFLAERIEWAEGKGIEKIILDPGMGAFVSMNPEYSWEIIDKVEELNEFGYPVLVGTSKKSFLGEDREGGTLLTTLQLRGRVDFLRVHDVYENATVTSLC